MAIAFNERATKVIKTGLVAGILELFQKVGISAALAKAVAEEISAKIPEYLSDELLPSINSLTRINLDITAKAGILPKIEVTTESVPCLITFGLLDKESKSAEETARVNLG